MPTYRIPLLVWRDVQGGYTAAPVEPYLGDPEMVGFADKPASAIKQMQSYLEWSLKQRPWLVPDFLDAELVQVRVTIRPEYRESHRVYPCPEELELRLPCVLGRQESGLLLCSLPTLGLGFHLYDRQELRKLVAETVRRELAGRTPQQLSRYLPPDSLRLEQISVRTPEFRSRADAGEGPPALVRIAQAIGHPRFRKRFSSVWKREQEIRDLTKRLGAERANVLLVGERSSGKTSILIQAVRTLERAGSKDVADEPTAKYRYWQTNAGRLVAGMKYLGEWEERCVQAIAELSSIDGVLCVEKLSDLVLLGGSGAASGVAAFLLSYLREGQLRMVGEATPEELEACRRLLPGFVDVFQILRLPKLSEADMREAMRLSIDLHAREAVVAVEEHLSDRVFHLFRRFQPYHSLPGAAGGFLKQLFEQSRTDRLEHIPIARAIDQFTRETGLPEHLIRDDCPLDVEDLERQLAAEVIGQTEPCRVMADLIARFKTGLNDPRRPLGVVLFCGPTGVGKTQLAKTVSQYLFGHGREADRLVRLDMSEYASPYSVERLITKEDGTPSEFISRVRQQPFSVVLLDEIEKAADRVYDILLGVLDEGRLTDRYGRTTTFRSAVLIMTSNLGAASRSSIGLGPPAEHNYETEVRSFFRPEFFNRLDEMVAFRPLQRETCLAIVRKELTDVGLREGFHKSELRLQFTERLVEHLLQAGFDPHFGARPLQRAIESTVVAKLARFLVDRPGLCDTDIQVDMSPQGLCRIEIVTSRQ